MVNKAVQKLRLVYYACVALLCLSLVVEIWAWLETTTEPILTDTQTIEFSLHAGVLVGILVLIVFIFRPSISNLQKTHNELLQRENHLNRVLSSAVEGYAVIDPKTFQYQEVNKALCEMLGYAAEEIIGKKPLDFTAPESVDTLLAQTAKVHRTSERQYEITMLHKDGRRVHTQYNANTIFDSVGQPEKAFAFITNVTHIKETQASLQLAKEKAEESTRLKDKFVSLIAHDLRNPIGAIRGYTELMMMDPNSPLDEKLRNPLKYIYDQSNDLLELINDLLDLSRLQSGTIDFDPRFFDAYYIVDSIVHRVDLQASSKKITLINDVPQHTRFYADNTLIGQVVQNLISNAIKFSKEGSKIRIYAPKGESSAIAVEDHGTGIDEYILERLFNIEDKTSTRGTAGEAGTGFGLPLSRQIMQAHQGDILVETEEEKGSTFTAVLPRVSPVVLVVDDDEHIREFMKILLESEGAVVQEAENGVQALDVLKSENTPHLIITDIRMPEMDGFELLRVLSERTVDKIPPIVVLTDSSSEDTRDKCLGLGAADFTQKPINPQEFMPRIRHFIG